MTVFPEKRKELYSILARLLKSPRIPLNVAVNDLAMVESNRFFRQALNEVADSLGRGRPLHEALQRHPLLFPRNEVELVKIGESSGQLFRTLEILSHGDSSRITRHWLSWAMIIGCGLFIFLLFTSILVGIVPKFESMFTSMLAGEPLPALTRLILSLSHIFRHQFIGVLFGLAVCFGFYCLILSVGPLIWHDRTVKFLPSIRDHALERDCMLLCQRMSVMLLCGHTITESLQSAAPNARTMALRYHLQQWLAMVKDGESFTHAVLTKPARIGPLRLLQEGLSKLDASPAENGMVDLTQTFVERAQLASPFAQGSAFPILFGVTACFLGLLVLGLVMPLLKLIERLG